MTTLNVYVTEHRASKYKKPKLALLKTDKTTIIIGDFNIYLSKQVGKRRKNRRKRRKRGQKLQQGYSRFELLSANVT